MKNLHNYPHQIMVSLLVILILSAFAFIPNQLIEKPASLFSAQAADLVDFEDVETVLADTPELVINETVDDYLITNGLIYWVNFCEEGTAREPGYLKRWPVNGGIASTLQITSSSDCNTFRYMTADAVGIYYFDVDQNKILFRPVDQPGGNPILLYQPATGDKPITRFELDDNYLYWGSAGGQILKMDREGATPPYQLIPQSTASEILVGEDRIVWVDGTGVWSSPLSCRYPPCPKTLIDPQSSSHGLIYVPPENGEYSVYRVASETLACTEGIYITFDSIYKDVCTTMGDCSHGDPLYTNEYIGCGYHQAISNLVIGTCPNSGNCLFWKETNVDDLVNVANLKRKALSGSAFAFTLATDFDVNGMIVRGDDTKVYFQKEYITNHLPQRVYRMTYDSTIFANDFSADQWEVTQVVQGLASHNLVDLVAGKPTFVRVYGSVTGDSGRNVDAILSGSMNGQPLPGSPLRALRTIALEEGVNHDRQDANAGWLFELPLSWRSAGTIHLEAVIDPNHRYFDYFPLNNSLSGDFTFTDIAPPCLTFVPIHTTAGTFTSGDASFWPSIDIFKQLWPIDDAYVYTYVSTLEELGFCDTWISIWPFGPVKISLPCLKAFDNLDEDADFLLAEIVAINLFAGAPAGCKTEGKYYKVGMLPEVANWEYNGLSLPYSGAALVKLSPLINSPSWNAPRSGTTLAHELIHTLGEGHIPCPNQVMEGQQSHICVILTRIPGYILNAHFPYVLLTIIHPRQRLDLIYFRKPQLPQPKPRISCLTNG